MNQVKIVFDVDDTICSNIRRLSYDKCEPKPDVIAKINHLHDDLGFYIVLHTARGMVSCEGDIDRILKKNKRVLEEWLEKYDVHYDELIFGKPIADLYVDDRCMDVRDFCNTEFGVLKGGGSGKSVIRLGKMVKKMFGSEDETSNFKDWVEDNRNICRYPEVISYLYDAVYMEYIKGEDLSKDLDKSDLVNLVWTILKFKNIKYENFDLEVQLNILRKNKGYDEEIDALIEMCERFLKSKKRKLKANASFSHGDMILSNVLKDERGLCYIDPRYFRESSSYLLDFGKLRMSLSGYEMAFGMSDKNYSHLIPMLDSSLEVLGVHDVVIGIQLMYVLRLYRYKDEAGRKIVKKMAKEVIEENEELFERFEKER